MSNQLLPVNAYKDTKRRLSEIVTNVCNNYSPRTEDNLPSIKHDIEYLCQEVFHGQVFDKISVDVRSLQKKSQWGPKANDDSNIISVIIMVLKTSRNPNNPYSAETFYKLETRQPKSLLHIAASRSNETIQNNLVYLRDINLEGPETVEVLTRVYNDCLLYTSDAADE